MVLISLIVVPISTLGFELPKLLAATTFSFCVAYFLMYSGKRTVDELLGSYAGKFLIGYTIITLVSVAWSIAPIMSIVGAAPRFQGVLFQVSLVNLVVFFAVLSKTHKGLRSIEDAFVISNILVVAYGILQMMHMDPFAFLWKSEAFLGRIFSTIGHPNSLGQLILLTLPFLIRRLVLAKQRTRQWVWASLCLMNMIVLFGTVSRSALLGLAVVALFFIPSYLQYGKSCIKNVSKISLAVIVIILGLSVVVGSLFFVERFSRAPVAARSTSARSIMFEGALQMIAKRPLGYGMESLALATPRFIGKEIYAFESLTTVVDRLHSAPLDLLVMLGPLGLLAYYGVIFSLLWALWKSRDDDEEHWKKVSMAALASYSIALLFGFASITTAVFFAALIGLGIGMTSSAQSAPRNYSRLWNICMLVLCFAALAVAAQWSKAQLHHASSAQFSGKRALAYEQQGVMSFRYDRKALMEATEHHIQAYASNPSDELAGSIDILQQMHRDLTNGHDGVHALLQSWHLAEQGKKEEALKALLRAKDFLPESITYHRTAIFIAGVLNDASMGEHHSNQLVALLPDAFWIEGSETRRILLKQHPWMDVFTSRKAQ